MAANEDLGERSKTDIEKFGQSSNDEKSEDVVTNKVNYEKETESEKCEKENKIHSYISYKEKDQNLSRVHNLGEESTNTEAKSPEGNNGLQNDAMEG